MTILDSTHKTAKPVEAATAKLVQNTALRLAVATATRGGPETQKLIRDLAEICAESTINELRRLGMINIDGLAAIKAEEAGKGT